MSSYEKTVKSLTEVKTISSHMVVLGKIRAASEDANLNTLIDNLIRELRHFHANSKHKSTPTSLVNGSEHEVKILLDYCKRAIGSKKPEWKILAERHGWTPPET